MRRVIMVILTTIIYAMFFISCSNISNIKSTELNNIFIDNLNIGSSIKKIILNKYTESNAFLGDYMCNFEEIIIDSKNNKINYLFGKFDENRIVISVNDKRNLNYIDEIKQILGDNYKEKWKDREQNLKKYIYFDKINNIKAEFVYVSFDESLVWIILSKINS